MKGRQRKGKGLYFIIYAMFSSISPTRLQCSRPHRHWSSRWILAVILEASYECILICVSTLSLIRLYDNHVADMFSQVLCSSVKHPSHLISCNSEPLRKGKNVRKEC